MSNQQPLIDCIFWVIEPLFLQIEVEDVTIHLAGRNYSLLHNASSLLPRFAVWRRAPLLPPPPPPAHLKTGLRPAVCSHRWPLPALGGGEGRELGIRHGPCTPRPLHLPHRCRIVAHSERLSLAAPRVVPFRRWEDRGSRPHAATSARPVQRGVARSGLLSLVLSLFGAPRPTVTPHKA